MIFQSFNLVTRTKVINNVLMAKVPDLSFIRALLGIYPKDDKLAALEALDKGGDSGQGVCARGPALRRAAAESGPGENPCAESADHPGG